MQESFSGKQLLNVLEIRSPCDKILKEKRIMPRTCMCMRKTESQRERHRETQRQRDKEEMKSQQRRPRRDHQAGRKTKR